MHPRQGRPEAESGYLDLGMIAEAASEIEKISPEDKMRPEVIGFRVSIYIRLGSGRLGQ